MIITTINRRNLFTAITLATCLGSTFSQQAFASDMERWYQERQRSIAQSSPDIQWLQTSAKAGDANANYQLGLLYQSGKGVTQDIQRAQQLFETAAKAGNAHAQYALALTLRDGSNMQMLQKSIEWQLRAAQKGLPEAQYGLGQLYANGQYLEQDTHKARHWFQQAAERNHVMAQLALDELRRPVQTSTVARAQPQVQPGAAGARGVSRVQPAPQSRPAPQQIQNTAAAVAEELSEPELAALPEPRLYPPQKPETETIRVKHNESRVNLAGATPEEIRQAASTGDMYAQLMLGALYEDGSDGVEQDYRQALAWYLKSARQGYPKAQHNLALLYEDGRGTEQDYRQAAIWYEKAAAAGFSEAQNNLAVLYILGNGVDADRQHAEDLLRQAVAQGNSNAERNLKMLMDGAG